YTVDYSDAEKAYPAGIGNYKSVTPDLAYGERLEVVVGYERNGVSVANPQYAGEYTIVLKDIKVYPENGATPIEDGNANYDFSAFTAGTLTIEGMNLVVTRKEIKKTYDGNPITLSAIATEDEVSYYYIDADNNTVTQLEEGYSLRLVEAYSTASANAGTYDNKAQYAVYKDGELSGEFTVTYDTENEGKLIIEKRQIVVITPTDSKTYDGQPLSNYSDYSTYIYGGDREVEALIGSDTLTLAGTAPSITDAGWILNECKYTVSDNYEIKDYENGTLTVEALKVNVKVNDVTAQYGEKFDIDFALDCGSLPDGKLAFEVSYKNGDGSAATPEVNENYFILAKGEYTIVVDESSLTVGGNTDKLGNYEFTFDTENPATLTVTARLIVVVTDDGEWEYDGTAHSNGAYVNTYLYGDGSKAGLIKDGEELTLVAGSVPSITNAGSIDNDCKFSVPNDNYEIADYVNGKLTVTPKAIEITLSMSKDSYEYGDETVKQFSFEFDNGTELVDGEELVVALIYNGVDGLEPKAVGNYTATIDLNGSVINHNNGTDLENGIGNYTISCGQLTFEITQKAITINLAEWADEVYNGKEHSYNGGFSVEGGMAYGEQIDELGFNFYTDAEKTNQVTAPVNAGVYYVSLNDMSTTLVGGEALGKNYTVTCEDITFKVTQKAITVTVKDLSKVYDGGAYVLADKDFSAVGLAEGETVKLNVSYTNSDGDTVSPVNAGSYTVVGESITVYKDGAELAGGADNYDCSFVDGTLAIAKRDITVQVIDRVVVNGNDEYTADHVITDGKNGGFVEGELAQAIADGEITFNKEIDTEIANGENSRFTVTAVVSENGDITRNYNVIESKAGTLILTDKWVVVTATADCSVDQPYLYDGTADYADSFNFIHVNGEDGGVGFTQDELDAMTVEYTVIDGDGNRYANGNYPADAGEYTLEVKITGVADCYIEYKAHSFTIARRNAKIEFTNNGETKFEYAGKDVKPDIKFSFAQVTDGYDGIIDSDFATADMVLFNEYGEIATEYNVGKYTLRITMANATNYAVAVEWPEIEITARHVVIKPVLAEELKTQTYSGSNLKLDADDFAIVLGELVVGDVITIESNEIATNVKSGWVEISSAEVTDKNGDTVTDNYVVHYKYNLSDEYIVKSKVYPNDMKIRMSYIQFETVYAQVVNGTTVPYTGETDIYDISAYLVDETTRETNAVLLETCDATNAGNVLYPGHRFVLISTEYTVKAAAGTYANWLADMIKIYDANDNDVTALYNLSCSNATDAGKPVVVEKREISVTFNGITSGNISSIDFKTVDDDKKALNEGTNYTVTGSLMGDHQLEVFAFDLDGEWTLGALIFRMNNGR
ncbi:MAG: hypothetical protein K2N14_05140, partial [Clostridia bacterium]|nr:hypothetical protein [Clostridia bacterium]